MVLFSWTNSQAVIPETASLWNGYLGFSLVMIAVAGAFLQRRRLSALRPPRGHASPVAAPRVLDWAASVGLALACLLEASPSLLGAGDGCGLAGSILASMCIGWSYVRWAIYLSGCELRTLIRLIFVSCIIWTIGRMAIYALSPVASAIAAVGVSLLSGYMLERSFDDLTPAGCARCDGSQGTRQSGSHSHSRELGAWRLWAVIIAITLVDQFLLKGTHPYLGDMMGGPFYGIKAAGSVLLCCIMLFWTLRTTLAFDFVLLWRCLYLFTACALLVVTFAQRGPILWTASSIATDPLIPILWLTVCTIARHATIPPYLVVSAGFGAYGLASYAGQLVGRVIPEILSLAPLCVILLFLLLMVLAFCLDSRDPDLLQLFEDLRGRQMQTSELAQINGRCVAIGAQRHLTPREIEVMQMLCANRSRSYIAETLYISTNTVKTHSDRLYKKLGIHSREELQKLVGL